MTTIHTNEGIAYFALLQLRARLKVEIATGLKHSGGSTLAYVNGMFGTTFKRKRAALDFVMQKIEEAKRARDNQTPVQMSPEATS